MQWDAGERSRRYPIFLLPFALIGQGRHVAGENSGETPPLVLIVQQHDRRYVQRCPALSASCHFTLHVLQEPIGEVIFRSFAPR